MTYDISRNKFYNEDCIEGSINRIPDNSVDLIITDPPFAIDGANLHRHYNRDESIVLDGYIEVPKEEYASFSEKWLLQAERILRPGGSIYIVSGYTNLIDILTGLKKTCLEEKNHIIWKFNFGVHTSKKYVSSHYHILFYVKKGENYTFNTYSRYGKMEKSDTNGSLNYLDREDVWIINREYKPGKTKNKNELPEELLLKMIQYSSKENDMVVDLFLGGFSTAKTAIGMKRNTVGFEKSPIAYKHGISEMNNIVPGNILEKLRAPEEDNLFNQGKTWNEIETEKLLNSYEEYRSDFTKKEAISKLTDEFGRGYFSILNLLKKKGL